MTSTVRVGILGGGSFAQFMAQEMQRCDGLDVVAVASASGVGEGSFGNLRYHRDYEALLIDEEVDTVYNALSNDLHLPWSIAALAHGKPVLCEKPLALDAHEAALMHDAAAAAGVPLMEAYWHLFHPRIALMSSLLASGVVGEILHIDSGFTHNFDITGNFRDRPERGGGMLLDIGCYPLSSVMWLFPEVTVADSVPLSVERSNHGVDLHAECSASLSSGATLRLTASCRQSARRWLEISGTEGRLWCDEPAFSHHPEPEPGTRVYAEIHSETSSETQDWWVPASDPRRDMLEHWRDVVRGEDIPRIDAQLSVRTAHGLGVMLNSLTAVTF